MKNLEKYINPEVVSDFRRCSERRKSRYNANNGYLDKGVVALANVGDFAFVVGKTLVYSICVGSR